MKLQFTVLLSLVSISAALSQLPPRPSATPPSLTKTELPALIEGVKTIPHQGAPGPVAIFGPNAFPVIVGGEAGKQQALVAASLIGKGRAVIFGHNGYLSNDAMSQGDIGTLMLNAVRWAGHKEKPTIGVESSGLVSFFSDKKLRASQIKGTMSAQALRPYDVVILNAQRLTSPEDAAALKSYIAAGGGLISGMTGWAFDKSLTDEHALNSLLREGGLAWTKGGFGDEIAFSGALESSPMINATNAVAAIRVPAALSPKEMQQISSSIDLAMAAQSISGAAAFAEGITSSLKQGASKIPTAKQPLREGSNDADRMKLSLECRLYKTLPTPPAHPAAIEFPGLVPPNARRVTEQAQINPSVPNWHSLGLYAAPGEKITVTVPADVADKGFRVHIGCHTDDLYKLAKWERAPEITHTTTIREAVTTTSCAFGGLVYIDVPDKARDMKPFSVSVAGAVQSPIFVLGKTTDKQWNDECRTRLGPWAEFVTDKVVLACPSEVARKVNNPTELMEYWNKVLVAQDALANTAKERKRAERIVADVQISAGYMHSGYPIMVPTSAAPEMVTVSKNTKPGWGFYHELGHNHQSSHWTFDGTGEVTVNLFSMWIFENVLGKDKSEGHSAISPTSVANHIAKFESSGKTFENWKSDAFLALVCYIQLIDGFGWEALKQVIDSYHGDEYGPMPKNDREKRDQWMVRYSQIVGKNLGPFFDAWAIPVSESAKASISKLPPWMPKNAPK